MKIAALVLIFCFLTGCAPGEDQLNQAMDLRKQILEAESCTFQTIITADYGNELYTFMLDCSFDNSGSLEFTVTDPETIAGIQGNISADTAALTFDREVLLFPLLADGQLTPVSAPWIFFNTLRSGYLTGCSREETGYCIYIDDSYEEFPLHLLIHTDMEMTPMQVEIAWQNRRIISLDVRDFTLQ